jgi:opacity protein-like surface antigen
MKRLALIGAAAIFLPGAAAQAADWGNYVEEGVGTPYEFGSGWYLRGDLSYSLNTVPHGHFDFSSADLQYGDFTDPAYSDSAVGTLGFGYQFNEWFRMDTTFDYRWAGHYSASNFPREADADEGQDPNTRGSADITAWTGLINAYLDLGTWGGITPYVGGGIGAAMLTTKNIRYVNNADDSIGTWNGDSKWNFAWALSAGASYAFSRNWLVDLGYRYINLGDAQSGETSTKFNLQHLKFDDLAGNELHLGLRYKIN